MSLDMYNFINDNVHKLKYDLNEGIITTPKNTNGSLCSSTGYLRVGIRKRTLQVHQILAVLYFGELCIGKQINHMDGNKLNNRKDNLEAVSQAENMKHQFENNLDGVCKTVYRYTLDGKYIDSFDSVVQASKTLGIEKSTIYRNIKGYHMKNGKKLNVNHAGGFIWKYDKIS